VAALLTLEPLIGKDLYQLVALIAEVVELSLQLGGSISRLG